MKRKLTVVLILSVFILSAFFVSGCSLIGDKIGEKAADKAMEKALEEGGAKNAKVDSSKGQMEIKTDQGSLKVGGTYEWPKSIPADVPKFPSGKITMTSESSTNDGKSFMVYFGEVGVNGGDAYKGALEQAGWKISTVTKGGDGAYMLFAEKDKRSVSLWLANDGSKGISGWVTYTEKTK